MLILISDSFDASLPGVLERYGEVTQDKGRQAEAEIILIRSKTKCTKEYIDASPKLKYIIRGGVGLDNVDVAYARTKGIQVQNTAEASTIAVAELAFALMIALPNHITQSDSSMREGKWLKKELQRTELMGKTLGILGMGRIGTALALRARAFRMKVLAWHPDVYFSDFAEILSSMDEVLAESDFISIHMPLLDATRGIINKETLKKCKRGQYMINTGRGKCVVEQDIVDAINSGQLGGYATDVYYSDPPENTPLATCPATILTPHIGASSKENMLRIGHIVDRLIEEYVQHKKREAVHAK
ncbi:MAG TPA: NAD(P)-dependent oxidoreductase [candidate division Zixibacteria bacterium]|nr:NAD(P)-dependent oxidoreductase [candidate division Zixibacteria bacterium]